MYYLLKFTSASSADAFWEQLGSTEQPRWQITHTATGSFCIVISVADFTVLPKIMQNLPEDKTRVSPPATMWVELLRVHGWATADSIE